MNLQFSTKGNTWLTNSAPWVFMSVSFIWLFWQALLKWIGCKRQTQKLWAADGAPIRSAQVSPPDMLWLINTSTESSWEWAIAGYRDTLLKHGAGNTTICYFFNTKVLCCFISNTTFSLAQIRCIACVFLWTFVWKCWFLLQLISKAM